ncbi:MAG: hypothetical protein IT284_01620 [Bacteroidetes bacterium]|nr:hypothetical protein [Bacteroidota bacterium]
MKIPSTWLVARYLKIQKRYIVQIERKILEGKNMKVLRAILYLVLLFSGILLIMASFLVIDAVKSFFRNPLATIYGIFLGLILLWLLSINT